MIPNLTLLVAAGVVLYAIRTIFAEVRAEKGSPFVGLIASLTIFVALYVVITTFDAAARASSSVSPF